MVMKKKFFCLVIILFFTCGCAARGGIVPPENKGIYHRVEKGQTLWKISKTYGMDLAVLMEANRLKDPSLISAGQLLFIPGASKECLVNEKVSAISKQGYIWPVEGEVVSFYGMKTNGIISKGITISAARGASVKSVRDGKISFVNEQVKGKGKVLIIDHLDGFLTLYAHNSRLLVAPGQVVKQGQVIAQVGDTGRADNPQLYFEIRKGHNAQNPFYYLP